MKTIAQHIADSLDRVETGLIFVITGAGISLASGIPTFRGSDPGAVWKRDVTELGTIDYFRRDPVGSWQWYLHRFDRVADARPNPAHHALAALERWHVARGGRFLLVTQNIDTLHEQAGSRQLVKVHGSSDRVRCSRDGCRHGAPAGSLRRADIDLESFRAAPGMDTLPRCPDCQAPLRQHVLWFDEYYESHADYRWRDVVEGLEAMHLGLSVGTSFSVGVTELVLRSALTGGVPLINIDPGEATLTARRVEHIKGKAEELLPRVADALGAS